MTLRAIASSAGYLADQGATSDVRALANLVMELAKSTDEFAQLVHDRVCLQDPAFAVKLSDFLEDETPAPATPPEAQCEVCAEKFPGSGQVCPDCFERSRTGLNL